jgi:hypothetical protein
MAGYHIDEITKGVLGQLSKVQEELDELKDAEKQGCKILALVELSDLVGAIRAYLREHYPGVRFHDLRQMSKLTENAFNDGTRR